MTTYSLVYASTALKDYAEDELLGLLARARQTNAQRGITGLLLYSPGTATERGTFVQVLEGPQAEVRPMYLAICRDPRHRDCTLLKEETLFQRRFAEWTMGFRNLATLRPQDVPGFNPIFLQPLTLSRVLLEKDPVLQLLYSFAGV